MIRKSGLVAICLCLFLPLMLLTACADDANNGTADDPAATSAESEESPLVWETIFFGSYEQDARAGNGPEPIEWIVLDVQGDKALLLSKYGLDAMALNAEAADVTWETCTLRAWLNDDFLNAAFTEDEASSILTTEVDNGADQGYGEWDCVGGNDTQDRVFALSYAEANRYLGVAYTGNSVEARVAPTAYALSMGVYTYSDTQTGEGLSAGQWWLRSPSFLQSSGAGAIVNHHGALYGNLAATSDTVCVRPAVWVDLEAVESRI